MLMPRNAYRLWYPLEETRSWSASPVKVLPIIEDDSGFSVDVLVYGFVILPGGNRQDTFGIGYVDADHEWHTVCPDGELTPLRWQYLPDPPDV